MNVHMLQQLIKLRFILNSYNHIWTILSLPMRYSNLGLERGLVSTLTIFSLVLMYSISWDNLCPPYLWCNGKEFKYILIDCEKLDLLTTWCNFDYHNAHMLVLKAFWIIQIETSLTILLLWLPWMWLVEKILIQVW